MVYNCDGSHGVMVRLHSGSWLIYLGGGGVLVGRNALLDKWARSSAHGVIYSGLMQS
jgi:hypothetical protein